MISVRAEIDTKSLDQIAFLRNPDRRLQALCNVINNTAKDIQKDEIKQFREKFRVRPERYKFMLRQIAIISPFASVKKGTFFARVRVGDKPRLLLSKFETGGRHESEKGPNVAIPVLRTARPTEAANIITELLYKQLKIKNGKGLLRTFVLPEVGVFQRFGNPVKGKKWGNVRKLYVFKTSTPVPATLNWLRTAVGAVPDSVKKHADREIARAFNYALKDASSLIQSFADESGD